MTAADALDRAGSRSDVGRGRMPLRSSAADRESRSRDSPRSSRNTASVFFPADQRGYDR
jgi:hypothetical protein